MPADVREFFFFSFFLFLLIFWRAAGRRLVQVFLRELAFVVFFARGFLGETDRGLLEDSGVDGS